MSSLTRLSLLRLAEELGNTSAHLEDYANSLTSEQDHAAEVLNRVDAVVAAIPTAFWINASTNEAQMHKRYVRDAIAALRDTP